MAATPFSLPHCHSPLSPRIHHRLPRDIRHPIAAIGQVLSTAWVAATGPTMHIDFTLTALSLVTGFFDAYH